jgi:hypothetical protein
MKVAQQRVPSEESRNGDGDATSAPKQVACPPRHSVFLGDGGTRARCNAAGRRQASGNGFQSAVRLYMRPRFALPGRNSTGVPFAAPATLLTVRATAAPDPRASNASSVGSQRFAFWRHATGCPMSPSARCDRHPSQVIDAGVNVVTISKRIGRSSPAIALKA